MAFESALARKIGKPKQHGGIGYREGGHSHKVRGEGEVRAAISLTPVLVDQIKHPESSASSCSSWMRSACCHVDNVVHTSG